MQIVILLYDGLTALDVVGPFEALARVPDVELIFVAKQAGPVKTGNGSLSLVAECSLNLVQSCDILIVPGVPPNEDGNIRVYLAQPTH